MDTLRQIIREELRAVLQEESHSWWHKPAEAERDIHLAPNNVHEAKEKKKRPGVGRGKDGGFTSAGTIEKVQGRKMTPDQIKNRKEIGKKMLNAYRRGGPAGKNLRKSLTKALEGNRPTPYPTDKLHQYSKIWARASSMAIAGLGPEDWPRKKKGSSKKKDSKANPKKNSTSEKQK